MRSASPTATARAIANAIDTASDRSVGTLRAIRKHWSRELADAAPAEALDTAFALLAVSDPPTRWLAFELVHHHAPAMALMDAPVLERFGEGMASWGEVDAFGCYLSGVAWRLGTISDEDVLGWARSEDRWWRRAALVSTVPLNNTARGGTGDAKRTLAVCRALEADRDDMVVKAMSWALRELAKKEAGVVRDYLAEAEGRLAARVKREVRNVLETGLKNPTRKARGA